MSNGGSVYDQSAASLGGAGQAYRHAGNMYDNPGLMGMRGPGKIAAGMETYQNPWENQVINRSIMNVNRLTDMQQDANGAAASASGAFGGSRHGLVEAETNSAAQRNIGDLAAGLRSQGFNTAAGLAGTDIANRTGWNIARSQDEQARAGGIAGVGGAAQGLGGLQFGIGQQVNQGQKDAGSLQQALTQALMGGAKQQYGEFMGRPQDMLSMMLQSLGMNPMNNTGTTTQSYNPGFMDYLGLGVQGLGAWRMGA